MFNIRLSDDHLYGKCFFYLAVACDAFDDFFILCCPFSHEMSWMRSGTELSHFLRISQSTLLSDLE